MPTMVETDGLKQLKAWLTCGQDGHTQIAIARHCGVSQPSVYSWIRGHTRPTGVHRKLLSRLTHISPDAWETDEERAELALAAGSTAIEDSDTEVSP